MKTVQWTVFSSAAEAMLRGPEVSKRDNIIISLRTVGALGKQSGGLFLAPPQKLRFEDPKSRKKIIQLSF